jgi:hypothetical protein
MPNPCPLSVKRSTVPAHFSIFTGTGKATESLEMPGITRPCQTNPPAPILH